MVEYTTFILRHADEEEAQKVSTMMHKKFPMIRSKRSRRKTMMTGISMGNLMTVNDTALIVLESNLLSHTERAECATDILTCMTPEECDNVLINWEVSIQDGQLFLIDDENS